HPLCADHRQGAGAEQGPELRHPADHQRHRRPMRTAMVGARQHPAGSNETSSTPPGGVLDVEHVGKVYPGGTRALRDVSLRLRAGQVHGMIGANGAGKSTLIKIIAGAERPTTGRLRWHGEAVDWRKPSDAQAAGVAVVHQQSPVAPTLSVLENVY